MTMGSIEYFSGNCFRYAKTEWDARTQYQTKAEDEARRSSLKGRKDRKDDL
jgi:hypothetical protein